jgi:hypothetical protein
MIFVLLTFLAAFAIEGLGTFVSVIGLSTLFGANPIIIALAIALDAGKLIVVTLLYSYWKQLGKLMKSYALIAATITMIITSAGAAGYLSGEFQKAILGTQEGSLKVDVLKGQIAKYEERKKQIDAQIAALPEKTTVNQRLRLMNGFKAEQSDLQAKISEIDKQLPDLQIKQIGVEAKAGPILYIAKAFDIPVESAVKYVILMIIFVFDPLAVFLIIAGNFLLHQHRMKKDHSVADADLFAGSEDELIILKDKHALNQQLIDDDSPRMHAEKAEKFWAEQDKLAAARTAAHRARLEADTLPEPAFYPTMPPVPPAREEYVGPMTKTFDETYVEKTYVADEDDHDGPLPRTHDETFVENSSITTGEFEPEPRGVTAEELVQSQPSQIFEVLEPTPVSPEIVPDTTPAREQIKLSDLMGKPRSSLNDVEADPTVRFDENPVISITSQQYSNLKQG